MTLCGQTLPEVLNVFGLALDICGVVLVWIYGISEVLPTEGSVIITESKSQEAEEKEKRYQFRSRVGLSLIIVGFFLQAVSTIVS